jgi:hypothetical protein
MDAKWSQYLTHTFKIWSRWTNETRHINLFFFFSFFANHYTNYNWQKLYQVVLSIFICVNNFGFKMVARPITLIKVQRWRASYIQRQGLLFYYFRAVLVSFTFSIGVVGLWFIVFYSTFNNIYICSDWLLFWVLESFMTERPNFLSIILGIWLWWVSLIEQKILTDLSQVTDKLYHTMLYQSETRCCTLRRAKNTPTHSFVSRTVNRE